VVPTYHGVTTQIIIVRTSLQINFHGSNQHGGMLVCELQAPLTVFGKVKFRMWGDKEFSCISRQETSCLYLHMKTEAAGTFKL